MKVILWCLCACLLNHDTAALEKYRCPEHRLVACSVPFAFLFLQAGEGTEWADLHRAALGSCVTAVLVKQEGRNHQREPGKLVTGGTGGDYWGESPEQTPCAPRSMFEKESVKEERFCSWPGSTILHSCTLRCRVVSFLQRCACLCVENCILVKIN